MPFISKKNFNKLLNKAYLDGYRLGCESGRFEATIHRYSPNELREILGLKPVDKTKEQENTNVIENI